MANVTWIEPRDLWVKRIEAPFRDRAPRFMHNDEGKEIFYLDGKWQKRVPFEWLLQHFYFTWLLPCDNKAKRVSKHNLRGVVISQIKEG